MSVRGRPHKNVTRWMGEYSPFVYRERRTDWFSITCGVVGIGAVAWFACVVLGG